MQLLPSYDQSPPIGAPFRFFLTAPLFGILAGVLILWSGEEVFVSRWTPAALAVTHLITAGFMLQVMLGALLQILPVLVGANIARPILVSSIVHLSIGIGALLLTAAFLTFEPFLFKSATLLLGLGVALFVASATSALCGVSSKNSTTQGLKLSLIGLSVTVALGAALSSSLGWSVSLPLLLLTEIHMGWGFVAWGTVLVAAVGYVVVPLFQLTPAYPEWFGRWFSISVFAAVSVWSVLVVLETEEIRVVASSLAAVMVALVALFAGVTLGLQRKSKRPSFDVSQHYWQVAMASTLAACAVWSLAQSLPALGEWQGWPLLCGVLVLFGGFVSVITGMLYKIVPFLAWLHLQNQGQGRVMAPNMKKIISEHAMNRQMLAHLVALALLLLAVFWPGVFANPAGLAVVVANAWLLRNLLAAVSLYRGHLLKLKAMTDGKAMV